MPNIRESEILHTDEQTGKPIAVSYDPGAFSEDTITTILNNQITAQKPLEIHCYVKGNYDVGGIFKTIEATDFIIARDMDEKGKEDFVNTSLRLMKGIDTLDIIFSEPLKSKQTEH
jgi:hypothetical protein